MSVCDSMIASALHLVARDSDLRENIIAGQRKRLAQYKGHDLEHTLLHSLESVIK